MLMLAMALTRAEVGWIRQHPELLRNVRPIDGLITTDEIAAAHRDWHVHARTSIVMQPIDQENSSG